MTTTAKKSAKAKAVSKIRIINDYNVAADSKNRISLRGAKTKHFHVKVLSNGNYLLEPNILVPTAAVSKRTLKMLESSVAALKKGQASPPIDLTPFIES